MGVKPRIDCQRAAGRHPQSHSCRPLNLTVVLSVVACGGSALLASEFGSRAITMTQEYPEALFQNLDRDWQDYARDLDLHGIDLFVPPVLGSVLTRSADRTAVPEVIQDLRNEFAEARSRVWSSLDALRSSSTLAEAEDIRKELSDASRLFSPKRSELDTRPVRVLWEIAAASVAGAGVAALSGGEPIVGAVAGAVTQAARNVPGFTHEFGAMLFGRGAFDLARRVRRGVSKIELDALPPLLTKTEKQRLGLE